MTSLSGSSSSGSADPVTVGVDVGTTSVKAVAVDGDGTVLARTRVPHAIITRRADTLEHDARRAWHRGPRRAFEAVTAGLGRPVVSVATAAMVPSLTAVDRRGRPLIPGLLYGDVRGRAANGSPPDAPTGPPSGEEGAVPEAEGFLEWAATSAPAAAGYWPAQAVATAAVAGRGVIDSAVASSLGSLYTEGQWNGALLESLGVDPSRMPEVSPMWAPAGTLPGSDTLFVGGTVDALCDQVVSGATEVGDVLVIIGATLITWVVSDERVRAPGLMTLPHTVPGRYLVGGPSNAGALFVDWARGLLRRSASPRRTPVDEEPRPGDPDAVPIWVPYLRGERAPLHDATLRAALVDLDITHAAEHLERAAFEAGGFVVRRILERAGVPARRVVASGGGSMAAGWMAALADATGVVVEPVGVSEGAAYGAAYIARLAAGLESGLDGAAAWARPRTRIEPDPAWAAAAAARYERFLEVGGGA